jgi:hypothetical protein
MTQTPMYMVPGVCKVDSNYSLGQPFNFIEGRYAKGRYAAGNYYRFTAGFPEKLGGWISFLTTGLVGITRAVRPWLDYNSLVEVGIGTESHLYTYVNNTLTDITPKNLIKVGTLTGPFTTSNGQSTVAVADTGNKLVNGDWVYLNAAATVGGLTIDGYYIVSSVVQGTGYNINAGALATSNATGGGTTAYAYPRYNLTNPFATQIGLPTVTVTDANHDATTGDYVTFSGATAYEGLTISGQYQVTVLTANTYTITASGNATGTGAGGGGTVSVVHNISFETELLSVSIPYGSGSYGIGPYGYGFSAQSIGQMNWSLCAYGNLLLACPIGGTIYMYDPSQGGVAFPVLNAPTGVQAMLVTPERFVVALGNSTSLQQISWADQSVITDWTSTAANTANSGRTLQGGSKMIGGIPVSPGVSLFWSDKCCFGLNYTGDSEVYNSPLLADNTGLLATNACVAEGGVAYWMSDKDFWTFNGTVQSLPSDDIRDSVFSQVNTTAINLLYRNKTCCGMNRSKREVWFFYVSQVATEIDSYVIYHIDQQCWSTGMLQRTAWVDSELFASPIAADAVGNIYSHESGVDANGSAMDSWVQTGPIDLSNGETSIDVMGFTPDFERLAGTVNLTVLTRYYPQDTDTDNGPYAITAGDVDPLVDVRADGRMVAALFTSNQIGGDWRLGLIRFDIKPAGARR